MSEQNTGTVYSGRSDDRREASEMATAWEIVSYQGKPAEREYAGTYTMRLETDDESGGLWFTCQDGVLPPHVSEWFPHFRSWSDECPSEAAANDWHEAE